ncbi:Mbov_0395 family pilin-like conjugal transfer protein [Mycoplasma tauri]|uniref:Mbov_0395 family pilin-like conjugal transfer protein n=1 Tax=Mycoplasma tauri TaxID=547987 RepID=UPI001967FCFB|nr:hypothetical protein [Mycoplasma tauri]MBZ4226988.1 pilin [Mycoplasma tauri]QSB07359.1 hypothetical protein JS510_02495 [Mycoplasma tauri]QSB07626.1 hypothetical protein JS510_00655 [Mycoplasma tauri]
MNNSDFKVEGITEIGNHVQTIGRSIFGVFAIVAVLAVIILSIWAGTRNASEDDPMRRKANTQKILWAGIVLILICIGWGIFEAVIRIQANSISSI